MAWLAQLGQREDLLKMDMAYSSRSWLGLTFYTQIAHRKKSEGRNLRSRWMKLRRATRRR